MLEKIPAGVGHALRGVRAGFDKIVSEDAALASVADTIRVDSPAFKDGGSIPARFTADGPGISPPLRISEVPGSALALVLIAEDPDAPSAEPFVHLLSFDLPPQIGELTEGLFRSPKHEGLEEDLGRNSFHKAAYLPPDPPNGHGPHLYAVQVFALDRQLSFEHPPSRKAVVEAMQGHVLAKGLLVGTYERPAA
ncbi:YbhB/YbcL family Raf kinase inhibitor-like protein [Phenylobacterium sp.]|uniref:YbhB/YbcL family Raf kinase inhibitor-like protein n=1 Tax=Phenylobacterium sp. TaxID=1871053 RepID=UPI00120557B6|nr:YbhB/YbcL family Raf kinase inhibitor-like protein [Phenylobacterium sp.]THD60083.1 MAG: YbhB/YbcL family Raf kinase inhibitor-like protein [Phenylobacterium sp.]